MNEAREAYDRLAASVKFALLREVFEILEYDENGRPGVEWSSDTTQALGDAFANRGVKFTEIGEDLDTESSASRQHYIDTGRYLRPGEAIEA